MIKVNSTSMLQTVFSDLISHYSDDVDLRNHLWKEIKTAYQEKGRYYHTLDHLNHLYQHISEMQAHVQDWHAILFTLFYHDFIYNPTRSDNESKSATWAAERMYQLRLPLKVIEACRAQILATKTHELSADEDTNYFTDADLSILGQDPKSYTRYYQNVRKEYSIYPDLLYKPGRKKVLKHFLAMPRIYKTELGYLKWEEMARFNLKAELDSL